MPDTKVSALPAVGTLADADVLPIVNAGASAKVSLSQLTTYFESRARKNNASVANQAFAAVDAYVAGSNLLIPAGRLQAATIYRCRMQLTKTSTTGSVSTPVLIVRFGTAGTVADVARCTLTFAAQTAVADVGTVEVWATFRVVGATGVFQAVGILEHQLATTGLSTLQTSIQRVTSAGFDMTVANLQVGCSFNGGTSFAGNTDLVQAELFNLA